MIPRCLSSLRRRASPSQPVTLTAFFRPVRSVPTPLLSTTPHSLPHTHTLTSNSSNSVRYYSLTPRREIFKDDRDAEWDMLRTGDPQEDDENANLKNWDLAVKRTCDIIDEVTDKQQHKTLHMYCQPDFPIALGKRNIFSIQGCTDDATMLEATKGMEQYQDGVQLVDFTKELPYRHHSHQLVVCLCPPSRTDIIPMSEIARILNCEGFAVIGATGKMWKDQKMLPQLEQLIDSIDIMSLQITELDDIECLYYIALIRAH